MEHDPAIHHSTEGAFYLACARCRSAYEAWSATHPDPLRPLHPDPLRPPETDEEPWTPGCDGEVKRAGLVTGLLWGFAAGVALVVVGRALL